jgi:hypothetical protein
VVTRAGVKSAAVPNRIEIMRYAPTRFHFLRLWQGSKTQDDWILMDGRGNHRTTLAFAKRMIVEKFPMYAAKLSGRRRSS